MVGDARKRRQLQHQPAVDLRETHAVADEGAPRRRESVVGSRHLGIARGERTHYPVRAPAELERES